MNIENKKKISIIVPVYNVPEFFLRKCIESCIGQTYHNIEVILVDDGSTDNSGTICDEYALNDTRICVIHKKNEGLVSARNAGLDSINGEWHTYVDGDDWIDKEMCEELSEYLETNTNIDIIFWKCLQELNGQTIKGKCEWKCTDQQRIYKGDECIELSRNVLIYKSGIATAYCKLINTEFARNFNIKHNDNLKQGMEGTEFSLRAFYNSSNVLYLNKYYYHYLFNPVSISKSINEKNTQYIINCCKVIRSDIEEFKRKDEFLHAFYQRVSYAILAFAMNTYFHPNNKEGLIKRCGKFSKIINSVEELRDSIKYTSLEGMDKGRKVAILVIRFKLYLLLQLISQAKYYFLKKGKLTY